MKGLVLVAAAALAVAALLGGGAPLSRVLLAMGMPKLAAPLFTDAEWQGVALYRAGEFDAAARAFSEARSFYNLGNAEAHRGQYAAALEAFDLADARRDPDARANFDVVAAYYAGLGIDPDALGLFPERKEGPQEDSFIARGDGRAAGTGSDVTNSNTMLGLAELDSRGQLGVRRVFDDQFMMADDRWLAQLSDVPGEYLAARISAEHKRRQKLGLSPPKAEDPR
ncbi:conserved hypothetical protein [Dinoroseobacter shibae DFL 12 = DSM 16493]|uniref:Ca-activated chloride channel family protein n=2 Tax=Dinoroseobacter shibae TaxID=215813 RepID=A8LNQ1_DINSH|nr:conserved hypothetical protein [Dinoroseobacter shibae DFL 12 = DSM 16493]